jgi:hypothetical protein
LIGQFQKESISMTIIQLSKKKKFADAASHARADYEDYQRNAYLIPSKVADTLQRRRKKYTEYDPEGRSEGYIEEESEDDSRPDERATRDSKILATGGPNSPDEPLSDCYKEYDSYITSQWKHDRRKKQQTTIHVPDPLEGAVSDKNAMGAEEKIDASEGRTAPHETCGGQSEEERINDCAKARADYERELNDAWRMGKK